MITIAVCDDEKEYLDTACAMLDQYTAAREICVTADRFSSASDLLDKIDGGVRYDVYLLDIYMPGVSGMSVATELRSRGAECPVIFLTSSTEHAVEAFGVNATHYLLKPYTQQNFFAAMDKAMQSVSVHAEKSIVLKTGSEYQNIAVADLLYCESASNYQRLLLRDGRELLVRMTAAELYKQLEAFECFYRCGRAYIVNLEHLGKVTANAVMLKNGMELPLPRNCIAGLRTAFFDYFN